MESDEEILFDEVDCDEDCDSGNVTTDDEDVEDGLANALIDNDGAISGNAARQGMDYDEEEDFPYEVLNTEQIVQHMIDCIKEVNTVVQLPPTITRILLNHFKWDREKLYERYYDGDREALFSEAHIIEPEESKEIMVIPRNLENGLETCIICFRDLPAAMMACLACQHRFCKDCWISYLTTKIVEEGMGNSLSCAAHSCDILVDDKTVMNLITDPKVRHKYHVLITNSFVECNRYLRWCPRPECGNAIKVQFVEFHSVKCSCSQIFCFLCGENWHEPVKCDLLKKWRKKCDDDSETSNWIVANTKECPKCNVIIEKDGGCNHMICKNQNCKADFCWMCLGPWQPHGSSYNCNKYDEEEAKTARDAQERSRAALQRYLFYFNRYANHLQSLKLEHKLYATIKERMEEMQQHNMSWIEVQFLKKAVDVLCQCRQTLMYTYVFAFYLVKTNQSIIFEENQKDLEIAAETLSEYLERDFEKDNVVDIKQKVQDKYRYCESRGKVLLAHVKEGYDKELWEYTVKF